MFILDDPDGDSWVMKSASLILDPSQTYESLHSLGSRLTPPSGWNFRTVVLDRALVLTSDDGNINITQDELGNTYGPGRRADQQLQAVSVRLRTGAGAGP